MVLNHALTTGIKAQHLAARYAVGSWSPRPAMYEAARVEQIKARMLLRTR